MFDLGSTYPTCNKPVYRVCWQNCKGVGLLYFIPLKLPTITSVDSLHESPFTCTEPESYRLASVLVGRSFTVLPSNLWTIGVYIVEAKTVSILIFLSFTSTTNLCLFWDLQQSTSLKFEYHQSCSISIGRNSIWACLISTAEQLSI